MARMRVRAWFTDGTYADVWLATEAKAYAYARKVHAQENVRSVSVLTQTVIDALERETSK